MPVIRTTLAALATAAAFGTALAPAATASPATHLTISVYEPLAPVVRQYELTCDPVGGTHPRAKEACAVIIAAPGNIKPVPPTANCYDRVFGPQRAKVTGVLLGTAVAAEFSRVNSCEEDRWQKWLPVWG